MRKEFGNDVWTKKIAFCLDGVSFTHKTNQADEAKAPKGRIWRRANKVLDTGCTAKGSHEGFGGKLVKMMVAIGHEAGIVLCDQYKLDGQYFKNLVLREFPVMFKKAKKVTLVSRCKVEIQVKIVQRQEYGAPNVFLLFR